MENTESSTSQALRFNEGKPKLSFIDLGSMEDMARVLEFGAKKYDRNNWKKGLPYSSILDSMMRHIAALQKGELIDPESGLPHHGHISCNAMFLEYCIKNCPDKDDLNLHTKLQNGSIGKERNSNAKTLV